MKEKVIDIYESLNELKAEMRELNSKVDSQHLEICELTNTIEKQKRKISKLEKQNASLKEENTKLKKQLSRYENNDSNSSCSSDCHTTENIKEKNIPLDSTNSSTPPSKESMKKEIIRRTQSLREKSSLVSGGQKGHKGITLKSLCEWDECVNHAPTLCSRCGKPLDECDRKERLVREEVDLVVNRVARKHVYYSVKCTCGCRNEVDGARKRGGNAVTYGKVLKAFVVYLNVVHSIPYDRICKLLEDIAGIHISDGSVGNFLKSAGNNAKSIVKMLVGQLGKESVLGFDETGLYCNGKLNWAWIAQCPTMTYVFRAEGRNANVLDDKFGNNISHMTSVTDRHASYFKLPFQNRQVCLAHILRNLKYLDEAFPKQTWSKRVAKLLRKAIHERNENPDRVIDKKAWQKKLNCLLKENVEKYGNAVTTIKNGLLKRMDYMFTFLSDPKVPSHNNASEGGFRKIKVKQKISGCFRSDTGADIFLDLFSICESAKKNNMSVFKELYSLV